MTQELTALKTEEDEEVLDAVAFSLLPNPGLDSDAEATRNPRAVKLITTVKDYVRRHGSSGEAEVFGYLAEKLSSPFLTEEKIAEIRARMGANGELPPRQYRLVFDHDRAKAMELLGIRRSHVEDAVFSPDRVQKLSPTDLGATDNRLTTMGLFVKYHRHQTDDPSTLLVHCIYQADTLTVWAAWRIYDRDIKLRGPTESPLDLLRAFVDRYGMEFGFEGGNGMFRFLLYEVFPPRSTSTEHGGVLKMIVKRHESAMTYNQSFVRWGELGTMEVTLAYVIRLDLYIKDLAEHGQTVDPSGVSLRHLHNVQMTNAFRLE